jgi:D-sedoheptulose 7-phosphate isomerase
MTKEITKSILNNGKLLLCGNGGSAADAQHLAAELLIRLWPTHNRKSVPAIALNFDTSTITACGNDYGFNNLYKRLIESLFSPNDVLLIIST